MKNFLFLFALVFAFSSCKLLLPPKVYHYDYHLRNAEIDESSITRSEVVCDLNIDFTKRVSGASREHTGDDRAMRAKEEAYFNALVNNNIDVLVSPIYQVEQTDKTATAIAYGFAGMYVNARTRAAALKEVQSIDSTAFYKYDLVWGGARIASRRDYVLQTKGEAYCPTCPTGGKVGKKGKDEVAAAVGAAIAPTVVYSEEKVLFNPYGPELEYTKNYTTQRKEKDIKEFKPSPQEKGKKKGRGWVIFGIIVFTVVLITNIAARVSGQ